MAKGALFGGIPGAVFGGAKATGAFDGLGERLGGMFGGQTPFAPSFSAGRGLGAISSVMGGGLGPGATAWSNSNPGISVTGTPWGFERTNSQYGTTEAFNPDGSTRGMVSGGLAGLLSGLFDGDRAKGK